MRAEPEASRGRARGRYQGKPGRALYCCAGVCLWLALALCSTASGQEPPDPPEPARSAASAAWRFDFEAPKAGTYELPVIGMAADGAVLDTRGRERSLHELMAGRIVLLSFVYLSCTDVCPVATGMLNRLRVASAGEPALMENLEFITVSFDPARDTPQALARHAQILTGDTPGAPWHFLTTKSQNAIQPVLEDYGQPIRRRPESGGDADIAHLLRVYLIDRAGRIRNIYGLGFLDPRLLLADVRTLLLEEQTGGA